MLAQPLRPTDSQHQVLRLFGNGIRPQIWEEFKDRFNIPYIMEFYGATEGNSNLGMLFFVHWTRYTLFFLFLHFTITDCTFTLVVNYIGKVGAIGFTTRILPILYPVSLIKIDTETGLPLRDCRGMCIHCEPGITIKCLIYTLHYIFQIQTKH